jgi:spermidine/putrescine transport system ATP-binding protein
MITPSAHKPSAEARTGAAEEAAIITRGLGKRFGSTVAVRDCSLEIGRGEFVSLLGPSGCGKTTLLRIIGGFIRQDEGSVELLGREVDGMPPNKRAVNTVFQSYALFPHKTVFENIAFPLEVARVPKAERRTRVREALDLVRLPDIGDRSPAQLSGGQSQRVALARALVSRPGVLLLDEPLAALDLKLRKAMQIELRRIQEDVGTTFLYVTHDQEEALTMSDRIVLMNAGVIVQDGPPRDVYDRPASIFASDFIGEANLLRGELRESTPAGGVVAIDGLVLRVPPTTLAVGAPVVVSVRPEAIGLAGADASAAAVNRLTGRVARIIFLGPLIRLTVELTSSLTITVALPREDGDALSEGDDVELRVALTEVVVLRAE